MRRQRRCRNISSTFFCQNFDFSSFPLLCEKMWELYELEDPDLRKRMPYCLFLHAMTEILNFHLLTIKFRERYWGMNFPLHFYKNETEIDYDGILSIQHLVDLVPLPIFDYINGIRMVKTAAGLEVYFNLPIGGTPQGPLDAKDNEAAMESGSFGSCTAETHNSYECYVSPYITRKLIERTLYANTSTDPGRFDDWSPLPEGRYPQNGIANKNLLGYQKPERLDADGVSVLTDLKFCNDTSRFGKICHSKEVLVKVNAVLSSLQKKLILKSLQSKPYEEHKSLTFICLDFRGNIAPGDRLASHVDILTSPESFSEATANKAYYFGYKRKRNLGSVGSCYTVGGEVPEGWEETRNDNFNMLKASRYAKTSGAYLPILHEEDHISYIKSCRESDISTWLKCFFKIKEKNERGKDKEETRRKGRYIT